MMNLAICFSFLQFTIEYLSGENFSQVLYSYPAVPPNIGNQEQENIFRLKNLVLDRLIVI